MVDKFKSLNAGQKFFPDKNFKIYDLWESILKIIPTKK